MGWLRGSGIRSLLTEQSCRIGLFRLHQRSGQKLPKISDDRQRQSLRPISNRYRKTSRKLLNPQLGPTNYQYQKMSSGFWAALLLPLFWQQVFIICTEEPPGIPWP